MYIVDKEKKNIVYHSRIYPDQIRRLEWVILNNDYMKPLSSYQSYPNDDVIEWISDRFCLENYVYVTCSYMKIDGKRYELYNRFLITDKDERLIFKMTWG